MPNVLIGSPLYNDVGVLYTPTYAGGSWTAGNPLTNLSDRRLHKVARSTNATETSTRFQVDLGVDRPVRLAFVPKHNLYRVGNYTAQWRLVGRASDTLFQYVAGEDIAARGGVFARSGTATFVDRDGVLRTAADGVARDGHWISGERTLLLEAAGTNLCIRSEEFDTWTGIGTTTVTANAIAAPDGATTADLITCSAAGPASAGRSRAVTFTADGEKAVAVYLKVGDGSISTIALFDSTAATMRHQMRVTWTLGVPTLSTAAGAGTLYPVEALANGWHRILFSATGVIAANTNELRIYVNNVAAGVTGNSVYVWGAQAENAAVPSSYIPTAATTVTRNADSLYFPFTAVPQAMTVYLRSRNVGAYISQTSAARVLHIGDVVGGTDPRFSLVRVAASTAAQVLYDDGVTSVAGNATPSPTPALGNLIEHRGVLSGTWTATAGISVNGGTEVTNTSGASGASVAWANTRIYFAGQSESSNTAITHVVIRFGEQSMDTMRTAYADSGWLDAWPSGWDDETAEGLNLPLFHQFATAFSGRYWSVQVSDTQNTDGYIDLARLCLTGAYEPSVNFTTGADITHESETTTRYTDGGNAIHDTRPLRRVTRFAITNLEDAEAIGQALRLSRQMGARGQCVLVLRPDATADLLPETTFLAVPREQTRIEYPYAMYRNAAYAFTEEL